MTKAVFRNIGVVCVLALSLSAQQGRITGPASGLVFDSGSRTLRPVIGIPGAATIGSPIDLAGDLAAAWVAPRLDAAITTAADGGLHIYRIDSGAASERALEGIASAALNVVFSPSGTAALLDCSNGVHVITGLPDSPKIAGTIALDAAPRIQAGPVGAHPAQRRIALAVSDDGAYVLSSIAGVLRVLTSGGENRKLADVAPDAVVAFAAGSHDAAVADSTGGVVLYQDLARNATAKVIAHPEGTLSSNGLAFSADGRRLFLSSSSALSVTTFDVQTGSRTTIPCNCEPKGLVKMGNVFRLNELGAGPLWLLDAETSDPRIVFVPALVAAK